MKRTFISALTAALLCGCASYKPSFDAQNTPHISEAFGEAKNQSAIYRPVSWSELSGWKKDDHEEALKAFIKSCEAIGAKSLWAKSCAEAKDSGADDRVGARLFFETHFQPYEVIADGQSKKGLITGYYLPTLKGDTRKNGRYIYPIYKRPADLVTLNPKDFGLSSAKIIRGRLTKEGKIAPYYDRATIDSNASLLAGNELFWVDDPIGLFFMHIQGSGLIRLPNGETRLVGYAEQNGRSYYPIGLYLVQRGEIEREALSMQSIRAWLEANPRRTQETLHKNPSYIFFEEGNASAGAFGAQGTPLSPKRSIAVDPSFIPLGAPVFIKALDQRVDLSRLCVAQDTGGAIKGATRADFFWGEGFEAEERAGKMRLESAVWILLPK
ncbi:MAG: MltA domain-containing protein [Helicobacteraceae bacterium]|jgi:membrane-bound lytic murein transglycosylase A|nr:MltA domain-containing protein [Helicobacteraceae bacterium]